MQTQHLEPQKRQQIGEEFLPATVAKRMQRKRRSKCERLFMPTNSTLSREDEQTFRSPIDGIAPQEDQITEEVASGLSLDESSIKEASLILNEGGVRRIKKDFQKDLLRRN
ncbi:hypothetical protein CEXT_137901 [Caerostris extrusa]|uniref:Uncharacterized protein n=1 Tax=Caerostris extrusa TaxID=172846 RepID=A0AAV4QA21_CAEEX|nr:hypothetical protein CEXT_137901 [Caerostris extrusa]